MSCFQEIWGWYEVGKVFLIGLTLESKIQEKFVAWFPNMVVGGVQTSHVIHIIQSNF